MLLAILVDCPRDSHRAVPRVHKQSRPVHLGEHLGSSLQQFRMLISERNELASGQEVIVPISEDPRIAAAKAFEKILQIERVPRQTNARLHLLMIGSVDLGLGSRSRQPLGESAVDDLRTGLPRIAVALLLRDHQPSRRQMGLEMPPFTYRLRFLIPRDRIPHTSPGDPVLIDQPGGSIELSIAQGTGTRPDNLLLVKRGLATEEEAFHQAEVTKHALMRVGLATGVPILFGPNKSGARLSPLLVDGVWAKTGVRVRPDVYGIEIIDETDGPSYAIRIEAEGQVGTPLDRFIGELTAALKEASTGAAVSEKLGLAIEVFMATAAERTPRTRLLGFVTVLEILAEPHDRTAAALSFVESALAELARRSDMDEAERRSLRSSLERLRLQSIGRSVRDLATNLDPDDIDGYHQGDIRRFLRDCYNTRSQLVHEGSLAEGADVPRMAGNLYFLLRHFLLLRLDPEEAPVR